MTPFIYLAPCWALLTTAASAAMKQPLAPAPALASAPMVADNGMASTYGFLRTASNNVGNTVEGVLGVEGSLTDMKKDLDTEYTRWKAKKIYLTSYREKLSAESSRLKSILLEQKAQREELKRIMGDTATKKAENEQAVIDFVEAEKKRQLEKKGMQEDIDALKCATKTIQQAKQDTLDAANKKTTGLKEENRVLQEQVFQLNKDTNKLISDSSKLNITNTNQVSSLLARVDALQKQIHGLEKELVAQAQLEESVQRARERLLAQSAELVRQREKLTKAQSTCIQNKHDMESVIASMKRQLNDANMEMVRCQNLDGENQKLQAMLNECILQKGR